MGDLLVLWDVDGTLLNAGGVGGDLFHTVFSSLFGRRCEKLAPMAGRTDRAIILDTLEMAGILEPRRHVDLFIEGLRERAPTVLAAAQRQGRALPGAATALRAVASARVGTTTIAFAIPGVATAATPATASAALTSLASMASAASTSAVAPSAASMTLAASAVSTASTTASAGSMTSAASASTVAASAASAISAASADPESGILAGDGAEIPVAVTPAGACGTVATAASPTSTRGGGATAPVSASAFISAATLPFGMPADASPATATLAAGTQVTVAAGAGYPAAAPVSIAEAVSAITVPQAPEFAAIPLSPNGRRRPESGRAYQSVLTGNVRALAGVKLTAVGLGHPLDLCIGAYGDDHEIRTELVHLARRRASAVHGTSPADFSGEATIVIGDTPLDIEAALAAGARAVGVATGGYSAKALRAAGAHAVLTDLTNTTAVLAALFG